MKRALATLTLWSALCAPLARAQDGEARGPSSAENAEASGARAFFEIGAQAYDRGDYDGALEAFHEAYARSARPGLLFSMAQAHRRAFFATNDAEHLARAVELYRKYLESGDAARRRDADEALEQLVPLTSAVTREEQPAAPVTRTGKLMIASSTPAAKLYVDGMPAPHLPFVVTVPPGPHTLTLTAEGFRRHERTIPVPEGAAFALDIPLEELPGTLVLTGTPGSDVLVDGRLVGVLPMPALKLEPGAHRLSVQKAGHSLVTRPFELEHGHTAHIDAPLVTSTQHKVSVGLLWAGGLGLVTTSVLGVAALSRQSDAQALLEEKKATGHLDTDQAARYRRFVASRNRLRRAAGGVGGTGIALALIGVALMAFDRPRPPQLLEQGPTPQKPKDAPARGELIAGPSWDMDHIGVEARGTF